MKAFKEYPTTQNDDSTYNIQGVEIFRLGKHKGFNYSDDWGKATVANHADLQENGYRPSVIIGHNQPGGEEKPSRGFLENIRLNGDVMIADITNIHPETFESLRKKEYPHRSVEFVNPQDHRFSALALLGGTSPYHKLPVMEVFSETVSPEDGKTWLHFDGVNLELQIDADKKLSGIREIFWRMMENIEKILRGDDADADKSENIKAVLNDGTNLLSDAANKFKENKMSEVQFDQAAYTAQFQATHGMTPEEAARRATAADDRMAQFREKQRKEDIQAFCDALKKDGIAPALVDESLQQFLECLDAETDHQFSDGKTNQLAAAKKLVETLVAAAKDDKLLVPFDEKADTPKDKGNPNQKAFSEDTERAELHEAALGKMKENPKLTYNEAIKLVVA